MATDNTDLLRSLPGELSAVLTPQFLSLNSSIAALASTLTTTVSDLAKADREANMLMFKALLERK